ncbi:MAG: DUF2520 domain-containing protein [Bacteroidota bacterium]|nr:DUF2520 domain-containing protein [Bacteroidota bacterium]MDP4232323.1 DUF2520 domain-containing protein [Bacteroidota bacterium]MDP4241462.1 DUF2520 domain-containing protein [Bacteroidota bacterium]MDP4286714.1 DUF2520 domain-containing protein [Bacteroidota bacterium]
MKSIAIIGKSKVGQSLAKAIRASNKYTLTGIHAARSEKYPRLDAEVIIIASRDDKIAEVAQKAVHSGKPEESNLQIILHVAGSLPATVLPKQEGVFRLVLHPMQTFPKPDDSLLEGIYWMASSDDEQAIHWARKFVAALGGKGVIELPEESLPLYHAMTVFAANFITLIGGAIEGIATSLGQDPTLMKAALRPLMEESLSNVLTTPAADALTGPMRRGDFETIRKHQAALRRCDLKLRKIYDAFLDFAPEPRV